MRAALSHSLSSVVGAYDSLPDFDDVLRRLPGEGILSAHPRTLSMLVLPPEPALFLPRSHDGSKAETRCMLQMQVYNLGVPSIIHTG
jgi:hypothetical protein